MNFIRTIIWKEFSHLRADRRMIGLMIMPVLVQLFIMGYALTSEVKYTPVAVVDRSRSPQSAELIALISRNTLFVFRGLAASEAQAREWLDNGTAKVVLVIPPDFVRQFNRPEGAALQMISDGQDANSSKVATGYLTSAINGWTRQKLEHRLAGQGLNLESMIPVTVRPVIWFNPMLKSTWYMIPALVVVLVTMVTSLLTGISIVKEKENGTFEQLMVTPIKPVHVIIGKIVPFVLIGFFEILLFFAVALLWFGIPFRGHLVTLLVFALVYMISSLGIGILTSTLVRSLQQVLFLSFFILIFFILLSGFFIPVENMPGWVQIVTLANPVRFFMFIVRAIFLKGAGFADLWREGLNLLIIGVVVFGGAVALFRRRVG
jgi:ABC-2 type transport system permease protein